MNYKKIINYFILVVLTQQALGQSNINFFKGSFNEALKEAKANYKPLLFMGYASWCPHCNKMKENVFTNPSVADFFNQHFICVAQDMEKDEGILLRKSLEVNSFPTFIILDGDGNTLYRMVGEFDTSRFIIQGKSALDVKQQLPYLKKQYEADISNANTCYDYLTALQRGRLNCQEVVSKYFSTQSDDQLLSIMNLRIISMGLSDLSSREFKFLLHHINEFSSIMSRQNLENKIANITYQALFPLAKRGDTTSYFRQRNIVASTNIFKIDSVLFLTDISMYEKLFNWNEYKAITLQFTDKYVHNNFGKLRDIANKYLQNIGETNALKSAVDWAKESMTIHEDYKTAIICAKLYEKLNDIQDALTMAKKARDIGLQTGLQNTSDADRILSMYQSNK
ncbi:MAG TPA: thioredoxin family protein [Flavisolibacter sp.]|nr:thioredoxin family protein [Flavisolibacter sp.]